MSRLSHYGIYCSNCQEPKTPKVGPRKILDSGILFPVYDLDVEILYFDSDSTNITGDYYYKHDLFCPKCGKILSTMEGADGSYWANHLGERATHNDITRFFNYCIKHPEYHKRYYLDYGYPGHTWHDYDKLV